ncbi:hypothetical protein L3X38_032509 [Prunus dulcis]|uniref:Uncharacterized protein n=1 Tax=Prunus dulcis TaxID=3755 RepID=A0AAD4YV04_PRUDU|nr:hypothetical protein L3X38_032509 [Prunus dulcis]
MELLLADSDLDIAYNQDKGSSTSKPKGSHHPQQSEFRQRRSGKIPSNYHPLNDGLRIWPSHTDEEAGKSPAVAILKNVQKLQFTQRRKSTTKHQRKLR